MSLCTSRRDNSNRVAGTHGIENLAETWLSIIGLSQIYRRFDKLGDYDGVENAPAMGYALNHHSYQWTLRLRTAPIPLCEAPEGKIVS